MSHFIKIYPVCKFSDFCLWYLKRVKNVDGIFTNAGYNYQAYQTDFVKMRTITQLTYMYFDGLIAFCNF